MTNSRPLLLVVLTIVLLLVALAAFWLAAMPQQLLGSLKRNLQDQGGYQLEATAPELSLSDGLALTLDNVSLSNTTNNTVTAERMNVTLPISALFGAGATIQNIELNRAVITFDVSSDKTSPELLHGRIVLKESILRLRDLQTKGVISLSDVNGSVTTHSDGGVKLDMNFLLNNRLTTFVGEAESAERLFTAGSPADFTVSAPNLLFGFSGQADLSNGLEFAGQANVEANDTAALFSWLGMPLDLLEGVGPFKMLSGVASRGHFITFENLDMKLGAAALSGKGSLKVGPDRMALSGDADISRIALLPNLAVLMQSWSEKPIKTSDYVALDLDLTLRTKQLQLRGREFGAGTAKITSEAQTTIITLPKQKLAGGEVEAGFTMRVEEGQLSLASEFQTTDADAKTLLGGLLGLDAITGTLSTSGLLTMRGKSPAELISTLEGQWKVQTSNASTPGLDLATMLTAPTTGWSAQANSPTSVYDLGMKAGVKDGVATLENVTLKSGSKNLKLKGEVDILRQAFDLQVGLLLLTGPWVLPVVKTK